MKVSYISNYSFFKDENLTLALGFFDGFHKGHMEVLKKALEVSKLSNTIPSILTFNESVYDFLNGIKPKKLLSTNDKIDLSEKLGFENIYIIDLSYEFINLSHIDFYNVFLKKQKNLVMGFDYHFGKNKEGSISYLKENFNGNLFVVDEALINNTKIGTSQIKEFLSNGDVENANLYLDRNYFINGKLYKQNKFLAFNTFDSFIPRNGEYKLLIHLDEIVELETKIKKLDDESGFVIKSLDERLINFKIDKNKFYKIEFLSN